MPYPDIPNHKVMYEYDGTVVGVQIGGSTNSNTWPSAPTSWGTTTQLEELNDNDGTNVFYTYSANGASGSRFWFFFPEVRDITHVSYAVQAVSGTNVVVVTGSTDTTNGIDGSWITATQPDGTLLQNYGSNNLLWRTQIRQVVFANPIKCMRLIHYSGAASNALNNTRYLHIYGTKATGQTPHDLVAVDKSASVDFPKPANFGDIPQGTQSIWPMAVRNTSATEDATDVVVDLPAQTPAVTYFSLSSDGNTWESSLNLGTVAADDESATFYVRALVGASETLGPRVVPLRIAGDFSP
jgi:hypothetical protein